MQPDTMIVIYIITGVLTGMISGINHDSIEAGLFVGILWPVALVINIYRGFRSY